jgi:hypothetical protein
MTVFTAVMWNAYDELDNDLGYIEEVDGHFEATASVTFLGSREQFISKEGAGRWLAEQYGKQLELQPRAGDRKGDIH